MLIKNNMPRYVKTNSVLVKTEVPFMLSTISKEGTRIRPKLKFVVSIRAQKRKTETTKHTKMSIGRIFII